MSARLRKAGMWMAIACCALMLGCGGGSSPAPAGPSGPAITGVSVTPQSPTATIGSTLQLSATVNGTGNFDSTVKWSVAGPASWPGGVGTISDSGLYVTPYPAPSSVTVTATSNGDPSKSGSATVSFQAPAAAAGPALTIDAANQTHPINPYIYGMNAYTFTDTNDSAAYPSIIRWGGDATSLYNYKLGVTNAGGDWYFENRTDNFNAQVTNDNSIGAKTMGTVPVEGWVAKDSTSCSFPVSTYPNQQTIAPDGRCGNGVYPDGVSGCTNANGCNITGNDPTVTSVAVGPAWAGDWVNSLVQTFGTAANGGVAMYDLDNEPDWWDATHRDVHPKPFTYDELTNNDIATALAIKNADPTAEVAGPVLSFWWSFFYSKKDIENGWGTGPCYEPWQNPADRTAHGGLPMVAYYLQQFQDYAAANNTPRLLDYLDLHLYFAGSYNGNSLAFAKAGDTGEQEARLNSTRVFWDPTYTDPNYPQPNYLTDANYTSSCTTPLEAPEMIPRMQAWVANYYPGTKIGTSEYNWGGQEHINGALAQADLLGIFGKYGLDLATLWGPPDSSQVPGLMAFEIYRNYDGAGSRFGDISLSSSSADQGKLSVYAALRSSDHAVTVVVINKTFGALSSTLSLANLTATGAAKVFQYSNADLSQIVPLAGQAVTPPPAGSTTSTISATFPAASITLFVIPTQ